MKIVIVVDANIILSALLGGKPSSILFDSRFQFTTTKFTISEVKKYLPKLTSKLDISQRELNMLLEKLPISIYGKYFYGNELKEAEIMMEKIDKKDVDILALAMRLETHLWSQDKDFEKCGYSKILKTHNFIQ